jgi:hypothetical protein
MATKHKQIESPNRGDSLFMALLGFTATIVSYLANAKKLPRWAGISGFNGSP